MTEPTVEARKAAFAAWAESDYGGYESVQAAVDVLWPIAEATVRAKVAAEILAHADEHAPVHGNAAQRLLRRHLLIGAAVAHGPISPVEVARAINEHFARIAEGNGDAHPPTQSKIRPTL